MPIKAALISVNKLIANVLQDAKAIVKSLNKE